MEKKNYQCKFSVSGTNIWEGGVLANSKHGVVAMRPCIGSSLSIHTGNWSTTLQVVADQSILPRRSKHLYFFPTITNIYRTTNEKNDEALFIIKGENADVWRMERKEKYLKREKRIPYFQLWAKVREMEKIFSRRGLESGFYFH